MSGALNSVFGGGGIFKSMLSLASLAFPPLALAGSLGNLLTSAIGQAVKMAASTLVSQFGMPKFLLPIINTVVDQVVGNQLAANPSNPAADQAVSQQFSGQMNDLANDLARQITDQASQSVRSNTRGSGSKASAGSWLEAIAIALGTAQGNKAAKLVTLADELSNLSAQQTTGSTDEKTQNAQEFSVKSQQLQAVSQEMSLLSNAATNTIKSIGEALTQAARKG